MAAASRSRQAPAPDFWGALLDALPLGIYVVDRDLKVVAWNRLREEGPLGVPRGLVLGKPLSKVLSPPGYRAVRPVIERIFTSGQPVNTTVETGGRVYEVRRLPLRPGERVSHVVCCFEDITERREAELRLISADRLAYLGQLVAGIAHEIANPLAGIAGCAEALASLAGAAPGRRERREARQFRDLIREEVGRAERLVRVLLDSGRAEPTGSADVAATVTEALRLLERHPTLAKTKVHAHLPRGLPRAQVDGESLKQVVVALATRAAQRMPAGGSVSLRLRRERGRLLLDVTDSGPALAAELRARLFEPYLSAEAYRAGGLGLAIARSLIRQSGGDLTLRPSRRGTTFRVALPLVGKRA
jgi:PAS domain S-box-containing protein